MTFTLLDAILIAVVLISAILAMVRGFSREVLSIVSWVAAAAAAFFFYPTLTPYAREYINSDTAAMAAAALAIFLVTLIVVSFITLRIADFIIDSRIGALDRVLGFLFGAARGLLLAVVAMVFFNWLTPENQPDWVENAYFKPQLDELGERLVAALPENPEETIRQQLGGSGAPAANEPATIDEAIESADEPAEAPPAN